MDGTTWLLVSMPPCGNRGPITTDECELPENIRTLALRGLRIRPLAHSGLPCMRIGFYQLLAPAHFYATHGNFE